jgi:uncharacterized cupin superfamily protein
VEPAPIHWSDVDPRPIEVGHLRAAWSDLGRAAGSVGVRLRRIEIEAGAFATPVHVHKHDEETFFVLAGSGLSWQDGETFEVRPGDCIVHQEAGETHTLKAGDDGLDVVVFGAPHERSSGARLPRAGVIWNVPAWFEVGTGRPPFEREAELGPPDCPEPSDRPPRIVNVEEAESRSSTRDGHRGEWRRLGALAGARRTGLNHIRLEAGQMAAPPHCHSTEEEIFVVLEGSGSLLLGDEAHDVRPGHVVARPAGTAVAHSFTAGDRGMTFLAYGTNEPNDICYYPRSKKIYFGGVGVITRVDQLDYWDGEP